jgi:serine/threonine-protein kinase
VGEELRSVLRREGSLRPERVIRMVSQIALGLGTAHAHQLVHRDLKPDNIFLCQTSAGDIAKVLDFGSVKDCKQGAKRLTMIGTTIGSPYYLSPEQAQGLETMDHRTDIWGLTVMVFECLTGTVPFQGNNGPSVLIEILRRQAPKASHAARGRSTAVPPAVDHVIDQGLQKSQEHRIATVGALADQLGWAYGLVGNHTEWAYVPETLLGARITLQLPGLTQEARDDVSILPTHSSGMRPGGALTAKLWLLMGLLVVVGGILGAMWLNGFS